MNHIETGIAMADQALPIRFDFVAITVNENETKAAQDIFGVPCTAQENGLFYRWGFVALARGTMARLALVTLTDAQGAKAGMWTTGRIVEILRPQFILVLGTAGGVQRGTGPNSKKKGTSPDDPSPGDVVIGTVVHTGTLKDDNKIPLRLEAISQPSALLVRTAGEVIQFHLEEWRSNLRKATTRPVNGESSVFAREIISTDINYMDCEQPLLKRLVGGFPRVVAIEMESGGVAKTLHELADTARVPGYLVIKGISDIAYREGDTDIPQQQRIDNVKKTRSRWGPYASFASATLAHLVITQFDIETRWPAPCHRLMPHSRPMVRASEHCSGVICNVQPDDYSDISTYALMQIVRCAYDYPSAKSESHLLTVFPYDPKDIWEICKREYQAHTANQAKPIAAKELAAWTLGQFAHFKEFPKYASDNPGKCARIVLAHDLEEAAKNRRFNAEEWEFFLLVNAGFPCWVVNPEDLPTFIGFRTDHVVLCGKLVLNYDQRASMLVVMDLEHRGDPFKMLSLYKYFTENKDGPPFSKLEDVVDKVQIVLGSLGGS